MFHNNLCSTNYSSQFVSYIFKLYPRKFAFGCTLLLDIEQIFIEISFK
jgi:hypothetical protein